MEKEKALEILKSLADGVDPFTGEVFLQESPYQNAETVRALQFAIENMKSYSKQKREKTATEEVQIELSTEEESLYNEMRAWRNQTAEKMNLKPYVIMNNATLRQIIKNGVKTKEELASVRGVGEAKVGQYGEAIIKALAQIGKTKKKDSECKEAM